MTDLPYGYCGMPCALCSRYRTQGKSKCPGCSHDGYYTEGCKVHRCCREKKLDHCGNCEEYVCSKLGKMGDFSDLNTNNVKRRTCSFIVAEGFDEWYKEYSERAEMLTEALEKYNNGRMKRFLCEIFIQCDLPVLKEIMGKAQGLHGDTKEKGKAFQEFARSVIARKGLS